MSRFAITSLNYMSAGEKGITLNLDYAELNQVQGVPHVDGPFAADHGDDSELDWGSGDSPELNPELNPELTGYQDLTGYPEDPPPPSPEYVDVVGETKSNQTFVVENKTDHFLSLSGESMNTFRRDGNDIRPMYDMADLNVKYMYRKPSGFANHIKNDRNLSVDLEDRHIDVYSPDMNCPPLGFVHYEVDGNCYMLTEATQYGARVKRTTLEDNIVAGTMEDFYSYVVAELDGHVILYPQEGTFGDGNDLTRYIHIKGDVRNAGDCFEIGEDIAGISSNYLNIIDQNDEFHAYENGDIYGSVRKTKNAYNAVYDMEMPDESHLESCRSYCGIGSCGSRIYLKYYDNMDYDLTDTGGRRKRAVGHADGYPFQKVEVVDELDYTDIDAKHKSSVFSVRVRNTNLSPASEIGNNLNATVKEKLRKDITNSVREFARNVCPANTTLFDVYFED